MHPDGPAPRVVVASDSFKGSLASGEVGDAVRRGLLDVAPAASVQVVPVADGGEGTVQAALAAGWEPVTVPVRGPTGAPVAATIATTAHDDGLRVLVEMADACGLERLPGGVPAPLTASSRGLGEAILAALDLAPRQVLVGVGGSASTDGGAGLLAALGARVLDAEGRQLEGGAALGSVRHLDLDGLDPRLAGPDLVLLADVDNPLLGPDGAAAVFGPQKGATRADVAVLEAALTRWATVVGATPGGTSTTEPAPPTAPGAGAAGGVGFALMAVLGARRRSGIEAVLDLVGLSGSITGAHLVVTGEGAIDAQTARGKAVAGIAARATASGVPVVAVCGRLDLDPHALAALGVTAAYPLSDLEPDPVASSADAPQLLRRTGRRIARGWLSRPGA